MPRQMHPLRRSGDVKLEVDERAELRGDDAGERAVYLASSIWVSRLLEWFSRIALD